LCTNSMKVSISIEASVIVNVEIPSH